MHLCWFSNRHSQIYLTRRRQVLCEFRKLIHIDIGERRGKRRKVHLGKLQRNMKNMIDVEKQILAAENPA